MNYHSKIQHSFNFLQNIKCFVFFKKMFLIFSEKDILRVKSFFEVLKLIDVYQ